MTAQMSFLNSMPIDGRLQRDDESPVVVRASGLRSARPSTLDGATSAAENPLQGTTSDPVLGSTGPRRHIVFPDPVAFRYLEDDPCVEVIERRGALRGYELYLVEQWACARGSPTLVVVTYTGDEEHSVVVGVLSIPADESLWSPKLRIYFKATRQNLARPKDTALGELMVTNLSNFPSALTVIPVPDGDIRKNRQAFIVNEDLKRLGCSGRSGLTLTDPTEATQTKFQQLYKTSDRIPFFQSVMELVKLCQVALYMFEKLDHEYIDGLLCDKTETAISNWWTEVGAEHYNFEPTDGILGPSTVAALLGMLMGARNRLNWLSAPVSKDVFDIESTKRGIGYFQRSNKLERTRRLDRRTLIKLHTITAKAAVGEGWGVQKAVKSTVTEIGGKRGELVMGMVSGKDKGGLADIETIDLDRFVKLAYGERPKWLWYGKARRTYPEYPGREHDTANALFGKDETFEQAAKRTRSLPVGDELDMRQKEEVPGLYPDGMPMSATTFVDNPNEREALRKAVFKSMAGKMSDARSGLGRIKDAVGASRRGHGSRPSITTREDFAESATSSSGIASAAHHLSVDSSPAVVGRAFTWKNKPEEYLAGVRRTEPYMPPSPPVERADATSASLDARASAKLADLEKELSDIAAEVRKDVLPAAPSAAASVVGEADLQGRLLDAERRADSRELELSRRRSVEVAQLSLKHVLDENQWPRRMSFSNAEEAILTWDELVDIGGSADDLSEIAALAEVARHLYRNIDDIVYDVEPWVEEKLKTVELLNERYARDKDDLQNLYHQLSEACQRVRYDSTELLSEERSNLSENIKEIEALGSRLEYEISALVQKAQDVEDGIASFERQVEGVEARAEVLKVQLETESWLHWFVRTLTGVGMGPNIVRSTE